MTVERTNVVDGLGESRVASLSQGSIQYYQRGTGSPIVFVQGLFANAAAWRKVVPALSAQHRCVTADWPFGAHRTPMHADADLTPAGIADVVADLIEHLDLRDVTLVGNDGGGMLTQLVITRRPERIARLVLTPCDAYENFPPPEFDYLCRAARIPGLAHVLGPLLRASALRRAFGRSRLGYGSLTYTSVSNELIDHYLDGMATDAGVRRDAVKILRAVDNGYTLRAALEFPNVDKPVLVAWAPEDKFFPFSHARRFNTDFPHADLRPIPASLTWVAEDQPDQLSQLIGDFIEQNC